MEYEDSRIQSAAIVFTYVRCRMKLCAVHSEERDKELQTNFVTQEHEEVYCLLGCSAVVTALQPRRLNFILTAVRTSISQEPEGSQQLAIDPYPEPVESNPHPQPVSLRSILIKE
jgi:hypothetical protein